MKTNREKVDKRLKRLKSAMKTLPESDRIFIYWGLLKETIKENCKGIVWVYGEIGRLTVRKIEK